MNYKCSGGGSVFNDVTGGALIPGTYIISGGPNIPGGYIISGGPNDAYSPEVFRKIADIACAQIGVDLSSVAIVTQVNNIIVPLTPDSITPIMRGPKLLECDTDGGKNPFDGGTVTYPSQINLNPEQDVCINTNQLKEYSCAGSQSNVVIASQPTNIYSVRNDIVDCSAGCVSVPEGPDYCQEPDSTKRYNYALFTCGPEKKSRSVTGDCLTKKELRQKAIEKCKDAMRQGITTGPEVNFDSFMPQEECIVGCSTSADCDDSDTCTLDKCTDSLCENLPVSECNIPQCTQPSHCDDNQDCTLDRCVNGKCEREPIPGCVVPCAPCEILCPEGFSSKQYNDCRCRCVENPQGPGDGGTGGGSDEEDITDIIKKIIDWIIDGGGGDSGQDGDGNGENAGDSDACKCITDDQCDTSTTVVEEGDTTVYITEHCIDGTCKSQRTETCRTGETCEENPPEGDVGCLNDEDCNTITTTNLFGYECQKQTGETSGICVEKKCSNDYDCKRMVDFGKLAESERGYQCTAGGVCAEKLCVVKGIYDPVYGSFESPGQKCIDSTGTYTYTKQCIGNTVYKAVSQMYYCNSLNKCEIGKFLCNGECFYGSCQNGYETPKKPLQCNENSRQVTASNGKTFTQYSCSDNSGAYEQTCINSVLKVPRCHELSGYSACRYDESRCRAGNEGTCVDAKFCDYKTPLPF